MYVYIHSREMVECEVEDHIHSIHCIVCGIAASTNTRYFESIFIHMHNCVCVIVYDYNIPHNLPYEYWIWHLLF